MALVPPSTASVLMYQWTRRSSNCWPAEVAWNPRGGSRTGCTCVPRSSTDLSFYHIPTASTRVACQLPFLFKSHATCITVFIYPLFFQYINMYSILVPVLFKTSILHTLSFPNTFTYIIYLSMIQCLIYHIHGHNINQHEHFHIYTYHNTL